MAGSRGFSHYGVVVSDAEMAAEWYEDLFGFERLEGPTAAEADGGARPAAAAAVSEEQEPVRVVCAIADNGTCVEFFEIPEAERTSIPAPFQPGYSHVGVVAPDIRRVVAEVEATGGEQVSEIRRVLPDEDYLTVYCTDPFGNYIEVYTHSPERIYGTSV